MQYHNAYLWAPTEELCIRSSQMNLKEVDQKVHITDPVLSSHNSWAGLTLKKGCTTLSITSFRYKKFSFEHLKLQCDYKKLQFN